MSSSWQAAYDSALHHPVMAWVFGLVAVGWLLRRAPPSSLRTVLLVITAETLLDAWLTGAYTPFVMDGPAFKNSAIAFVIVGDLRLWWLLERFRRPGVSWGRALARALPWTLLVPVLQVAALKLVPSQFPTGRHIFVLYEGAFAALCGVLLAGPYFRAAEPAEGRYARQLTAVFGLQYLLWVTSDLLILSGQEWALGLRIVPNAIYYGVFVLLIGWLAPREAWR